MRFRIYPYKAESSSAWALRDALRSRSLPFLILHRGTSSSYRPSSRDLIINWGSSTMPRHLLDYPHNIINPPNTVSLACDKRAALSRMREAGVRIPAFTTDPEVAAAWAEEGSQVVVRSLSRASGGRGIELVDDPAAIPSAPLYTRYVKKKEEYRVHVMFGGVVDVQRKARELEVPDEEVNWQIRNAANGFIYARESCDPPMDVLRQGRDAVRALYLDFGAADVVWNEHYGEATVLEVNTACGLEGTTGELYADTFTDYISKRVTREEEG